MKLSRYTEFQILKNLKQVDGGKLMKEVCLKNGIPDTMYYSWNIKHGGIEASDITRLKKLDSEYWRLKQIHV